MKKIIYSLLIIMTVVTSCGTTSTVPVTGRKQNILVSDEELLSLSAKEYNSYIKKAVLSTNPTQTVLVRRVGQRLANAVEQYLTANNMSQDLKNYKWEFNLVRDNAANAFCMPGGKIVVYDGLLPITQDEASLAIVLGHEIAHAVARHSAEQMSKQIKQQVGAKIVGGLLSVAGVGQTVSDIAGIGYGLGSKFSLLHYSRKHESEADYMGLVFAAMAGYDPHVAVSFWERMASNKSGHTPEFLSTHPSHAKRIADIQRLLPQVLTYYKGAASQPVAQPRTRTSSPAVNSISAKKLY